MSRITKDGHTVEETDFVYEVMYRYLNAEASLAEPEKRMMKDVPKEVNIWKYRLACWIVCNAKNKKSVSIGGL